MNVHRLVAAVSATTLVAGLAFAQRDRERRIHVSSENYHYKAVSIRNRGVRLVRRRSNAPCVQGRSWGYNRNRIWVDRGCAADFVYTARR